jgi:hypothetical protein
MTEMQCGPGALAGAAEASVGWADDHPDTIRYSRMPPGDDP